MAIAACFSLVAPTVYALEGTSFELGSDYPNEFTENVFKGSSFTINVAAGTNIQNNLTGTNFQVTSVGFGEDAVVTTTTEEEDEGVSTARGGGRRITPSTGEPSAPSVEPGVPTLPAAPIRPIEPQPVLAAPVFHPVAHLLLERAPTLILKEKPELYICPRYPEAQYLTLPYPVPLIIQVDIWLLMLLSFVLGVLVTLLIWSIVSRQKRKKKPKK